MANGGEVMGTSASFPFSAGLTLLPLDSSFSLVSPELSSAGAAAGVGEVAAEVGVDDDVGSCSRAFSVSLFSSPVLSFLLSGGAGEADVASPLVSSAFSGSSVFSSGLLLLPAEPGLSSCFSSALFSFEADVESAAGVGDVDCSFAFSVSPPPPLSSLSLDTVAGADSSCAAAAGGGDSSGAGSLLPSAIARASAAAPVGASFDSGTTSVSSSVSGIVGSFFTASEGCPSSGDWTVLISIGSEMKKMKDSFNFDLKAIMMYSVRQHYKGRKYEKYRVLF